MSDAGYAHGPPIGGGRELHPDAVKFERDALVALIRKHASQLLTAGVRFGLPPETVRENVLEVVRGWTP